ncbi:hypothetical protein E4Z66_11405 [Aliishimia ponticola]|uniref:Uncharacterized protein n=1 Tax=Aliishimia ponticola TaxID=2499833 RepID=A0A4S4NHW3_9RHOB|nr:hypothetical protein [Aliishimia ponticola]THH35690.1 hypothetical protein E4Z66_11405 [Aliishimia ponticola]
MTRILATVLSVGLAAPVWAASDAEKEAQCALQAQLMGKVQQARLDRVRKNKAVETLVSENPQWPEGISSALPAVVEYVYSLKMRDLRNTDLEADTKITCIENFEQIQALRNNVSN